MFLNHFEMHKPVDVVKMLPESNEAHVEELLKVLVTGGSATMDPPCHTCPVLTGPPQTGDFSS